VESVLVRWMGVADTNMAGFVHGGTVMKLCDEVAGIAAIRHSHSRVVTAGMDRMTFLGPVELGDLVTFRATVKPTAVPPLEVEHPEHLRRQREAHTRRDNRLAEREQLKRIRDAESN
jgi:acyl-CoA hydrolase